MVGEGEMMERIKTWAAITFFAVLFATLGIGITIGVVDRRASQTHWLNADCVADYKARVAANPPTESPAEPPCQPLLLQSGEPGARFMLELGVHDDGTLRWRKWGAP